MSKNHEKNKPKTQEPKPRVKMPLYSIFAVIFGVMMLTGIIMAFLNFKSINSNGLGSENKPVLIIALILTIVGMLGMSASIIMSIRVLIKYDKELSAAREHFTIDPAVLKDERIKQLPEVKKLMKRENIARIFEAGKISAADLSDPYVQQLIDALLARADENGVIRL